ncbi:hypothetical protein IIA79_05900 [bacterium]|nr:hypothetical protein [bacterium]
MSSERMKVLEMIADGKINPEEAARLLEALSQERGGHRRFKFEMPDVHIPKIDLEQIGEVYVELKKSVVNGAQKAEGSFRRSRAAKYIEFKDYPISVEAPEGIDRCKMHLQLRAGKLRLKAGDTGGPLFHGKARRVHDEPVVISEVRDGLSEVTLKHSLGRLSARLSPDFSYSFSLDNAAGDSSLDFEGLKVEELKVENNAGSVSVHLGGEVDRVEVDIQNNAGNVMLKVPDSHAVRITPSGSLSAHNLEKYGLEIIDGVAASSDWDSNSKGVDIVLSQHVANFQLAWKRRNGVKLGASKSEDDEGSKDDEGKVEDEGNAEDETSAETDE